MKILKENMLHQVNPDMKEKQQVYQVIEPTYL